MKQLYEEEGEVLEIYVRNDDSDQGTPAKTTANQ
jgi:hypothetical protein